VLKRSLSDKGVRIAPAEYKVSCSSDVLHKQLWILARAVTLRVTYSPAALLWTLF
jgi:hypothetical protein